MNEKERKYFSPETKATIVKEHLVGGRPVSELCDKHQIQPTVFYRWQKEMFDQGDRAFERPRKSGIDGSRNDQTIAALEAKLARKDAVLAELMEEHVKLKKSPGDRKQPAQDVILFYDLRGELKLGRKLSNFLKGNHLSLTNSLETTNANV